MQPPSPATLPSPLHADYDLSAAAARRRGEQASSMEGVHGHWGGGIVFFFLNDRSVPVLQHEKLVGGGCGRVG